MSSAVLESAGALLRQDSAAMTETPQQTALSTLSRFVLAESDLEGTLYKIAELTRQAIPAAAMVGYSILDENDKPSTPVYTDEKAPQIDQSQYYDDKGPCLDAGRSKTVVRVDNVSEAVDRYPSFAKAAYDHGIKSTLSLPLVVNDKATGAMNLYAVDVDAFSAEDQATGTTLANAISVVLTNVMSYWHVQSIAEHLSEAMKSRAVIEQAKGMLMAQQRGMTSDEAFEMIKATSQRANIKVRDVAQQIVDRSTGASGN